MDLIIRKYSCGRAELWADKKQIGHVGNERLSQEGTFGRAFDREKKTLHAIGKLFGFSVKHLNYEENQKYEEAL